MSTSSSRPAVLGEKIVLKPIVDSAYQKLPPKSRQQIENFSSLPAVNFFENKLAQLKEETNDFPQKQINDIKKAVVQKIYESVMKSLK